MLTENLTGSFVISSDHPSIAGHFPGHPIVPGVVLLAEVECLLSDRFPGIELLKVVQAKFNRPVTPGQSVCITLDMIEAKPAGQLKANFKLFTEADLLVASGQFLLERQD